MSGKGSEKLPVQKTGLSIASPVLFKRLMQVRLLSLSDVSADIWAAKAQLRDASPNYDSPLFDSEIVRSVAQVRSDVRLLMAEDAEGVAAVWPLHVRPGHWARPIAGPFSDWHAPILRAGVETGPKRLLMQAGLSGMTVHSLAVSQGAVPAMAFDEAYLTDLSAGYDAFESEQRQLHPAFFKKIRRLERKLDKEHAEVRFTYNDSDPAAFDWLIGRKRAQLIATGRQDVLAPDWARAYVQRLRQIDSPRFGSILSTLRVDGRLAAAEFNLHSDRVMHGWLAAFSDEFSAYSPGHILVRRLLEAMPSHGLSVYDAGAHFGHYKKYFSNQRALAASGVLTGRASVHLSRLLAQAWQTAESHAPQPVQRFLGKVRRRTDQILMSETAWHARVLALAAAARSMGAASRLAASAQDR